MNKLIIALLAAGFAFSSVSAFAAGTGRCARDISEGQSKEGGRRAKERDCQYGWPNL